MIMLCSNGIYRLAQFKNVVIVDTKRGEVL